METRVGDVLDDYCTRCHRLTNHTVTALDGGSVVRTTCRTCAFLHPYRGGVQPAGRHRPQPSDYDRVLAGILGETAPPPDDHPKGKGKRSRR